MKSRIIILLSLLPFLVSSCLSERFFEREGQAEVRVGFSLDSFSLSRSSSASSEDGILTLQLFVVDSDGDIVHEAFQNGSAALSFRGRVGEKYRLYAFANSPSRIGGLETEDDILGWEYSTDLSGHFPSGFPMAGIREYKVSEGDTGCTIEMVRLVSKVLLTLDKSEMNLHGAFTLNSVKLHNCPSRLKPFAQNQKALDASDVGDGDLASADDLAKLNAGESVSFYILENMQGDLLPSNTDPWEKIPSNLTSAEGLCTYLEASGSYISPGYNGSDSYRMYLGKDNIKNFDLCRNSLYRLTLSPTEDNMRKDGNWKITASDWTDTRKMSFSNASVDILPGNSQTVTVSCSPSQFEFTLSENGFSAAGLSYSVSGSSITISCSSDAERGNEATLTAKSWDGRVEAVCSIRIGEGLTVSETLTISPENPVIAVGESLQMEAMMHTEYFMDGEPFGETDNDVTYHQDTNWYVGYGDDCISITNGEKGRKLRGLLTGLAKGTGCFISCTHGSAATGTSVTVE